MAFTFSQASLMSRTTLLLGLVVRMALCQQGDLTSHYHKLAPATVSTYSLVDLVITATTKQSGKAYKAAGTAAIAAERGKQQFYKRSYMHRPNEPQHDIVAFGQETDGPLGLEARGILKFLAERPAR